MVVGTRAAVTHDRYLHDISLPIPYLLSGSEHINWNLDVEGEMYSIQGTLQECNDKLTFTVYLDKPLVQLQ